ncbi:cell division protein ZapA [Spirosoma koreense]
MEELLIRVKIADRHYKMFVEPDAEALVRDVARQIQDQIKQYRGEGFKDTRDALAMVAFDCLINRIKGEQQMQRLQQLVFDKITQLDQATTPVVTT